MKCRGQEKRKAKRQRTGKRNKSRKRLKNAEKKKKNLLTDMEIIKIIKEIPEEEKVKSQE